MMMRARWFVVGTCGLGFMATAVSGGLPDWTLVSDQTVISTSSETLTRSLRRVVLNDAETLMYATFLQKSLGAGVREYTLTGDPPTATAGAFFNVTSISPSGTDHQPEGLDVDDRGFVYVGSSKDSTGGDNARVIILPTGLGSNQVFVLADIDFIGNTGESVGDLRIRKDGGTYQLYVSRHHLSSAYVERYIVGGSSVGSLTLTLDTSFSGDGRFNLRTEGGFPTASGLRGIDVAQDGTIFVVTREDDLLYKISSDLTTVTTVALSNPMGVALYDDRAFVTQYNGDTSSIAEVNQASLAVLSTFDAFDDFPRDPIDGTLAGYAGIDVDSNGHVFVGDQLYFRTSAESRDRVLRSSSFAPPPPPMLSLEVLESCPDDWDNNAGNGYQVAVELWMRELDSNATGFQAFLLYDDGVMTYNPTLSSYTSTPFPLHLTPIGSADIGGGSLWLDGSDNFLGPGTSDDSLLATLVFDVDVECSVTSVDFDTTFIFDSELSFEGTPLVTALSNSPAMTLDDTPPVLDPCPADITQSADAGSGDGCLDAIVFYSDPGAVDACSAVTVDCVPPSGSIFPVGTTTVTCTATDDCGNTSECMFDITVTSTNVVEVDAELVGVYVSPTVRCIHFVLDDCGVTADATLTFIDHDGDDANMNGTIDATEGGSNTPATPVRAVGQPVEVPCGVWTQICAKDEQHTLWDTVSLTISGPNYVTVSLISLEPGDNDNDGDVDINDVTFIVANFGAAELPGGCPWDGTRGTDFSNNGLVHSEDYSLLVSNWLALTSCSCTSPAMAFKNFDQRTSIHVSLLDPYTAKRVDLNKDGVFDANDLRIFEHSHGIQKTLSNLWIPVNSTDNQFYNTGGGR